MIYFLVHIGKIPTHLTHCIDQILKIDSLAKVYLASDNNPNREDVEYITLNDLCVPNIGSYLKNDPDPLWHTSLMRIFYINSFLQLKGEPIIHFDNDVLIYEPFEKISSSLTKGIYITPHRDNEYTFGYSHISDADKFNELSIKIHDTIMSGEANVKRALGEAHEMRLLGHCGANIITDLPVYPSLGDISNYIFDPSSYGQYIGGSPNSESPGAIHKHQIVGNMLSINSSDSIHFDKKPYIIHDNKQYEIFNLHIHSKNLKKFIS